MAARSVLGKALLTALALFAWGCTTHDHPAGDPSGSGGTGSGSGGSGGSGGAVSDAGPSMEAGGHPVTTVANKLDLLLMIDDSSSMNTLQAKFAAQVPALFAGFSSASGAPPDLHVGVVSSSFGGGAWSNVNQCVTGSYPGDDQGKLQQGPGGAGKGSCKMLHARQTFLATGDGTAAASPNFDGSIWTAVQCMIALGESGCGFESQFKSVVRGLTKAADPADPDNGGFLRPDARLAVIMLTNEDDCSVDDDSLLLYPGIDSVTDPAGLGALDSYRCNEFGHLCDGQPPPHGYDFTTNTFDLPTGTFQSPTDFGSGGVTLQNCVSADQNGKTDPMIRDPNGHLDPEMGHLYGTIPGLISTLRGFKGDPDDVFVAAIAGPAHDGGGHSLYRVFALTNPAAGGELTPEVDYSCVQATTDSARPEYGLPAVRIEQLVDGFGTNGAFYPICADDFSKAAQGIASGIQRLISR